MENKYQFRARIRNVNYEYLEDYQINNDYNTIGEAVDAIIAEHRELSKNNWSLNYITNVVTSQVSKGVQAEVKKAMLGINHADRNTQILIELVQGFMQHYEVEGIITTEVHSPIFMKEVERLVKERITKQKQKKDSRVR
ncbi:MAG TPA: hypothetical protein H9895_04465 [Candidatus Pseudogracilibacillus intestinigallinarum]|uniref:Uncharacterized protein n=1 Tax=Candidatus Pseudogracilibacillus intestinigallinarum TaxID=2838742 RepID=A0A9D1PMY1_9BACI|nr:hypothetical protein [Candidatus Pseudogracilibacillus intestinigallinarum]